MVIATSSGLNCLMLQCNKQNADALFQAGRLRLMVFMPEEGIQAMTKYLGSSEHKSGG